MNDGVCNYCALKAFADEITGNMFANDKTFIEAYDYAMSIAKSCGPQSQAGVITAIHVLMNSIAEEIRANISPNFPTPLQQLQSDKALSP